MIDVALVFVLAAAPGSALVEVSPISAEISPRLTEKLSELLRAELTAAGVAVMSPADVARLREGRVDVTPPDLREAQRALQRGKDLYLTLDFAQALAPLESARAGFEAALVQGADFAPIADAATHLAAAHLGLGDQAAARGVFLRLLQLRSSFELDARTYSPSLLEQLARARETFDASPRASLDVSSVPPLATVLLDGEKRGEAPLRLDRLPVGKHTLRVEAPGHQPWAQVVELPAAGLAQVVHLEPLRAGDELRALETAVRAGQPVQATLDAAAALARSVRVDAVVIAALTRDKAHYALSVALVEPSGQHHRAWTVIDDNFLLASAAARALVASLLSTRGPVFAPAGPTLTHGFDPDFEACLLGFGAPVLVPEVAVVPAVIPVAAPLVVQPAVEPAPTPISKRWWFWTAIAVVVAGAAATTAYVLTPAPVVQRPDTVTITIDVQP